MSSSSLNSNHISTASGLFSSSRKDLFGNANENTQDNSNHSEKGEELLDPLYNTEEGANRKLNIGPLNIWALGITIVIGGQYFSWNAGLVAGFGSYMIATFLIGTAYICLCLCTAEISSALPFAGGAYGLARVCLGLYPGFMVGCAEAIEYMVYTASSTVSLALMIAKVTSTSESLVPVYCSAFYITALYIHIAGGQIFWKINALLGIISFVIIVVYILGCSQWMNLPKYGPAHSTTGANEDGWFIGGILTFLQVLPLSAWFYVGVESLNLGNAYPAEPEKVIPKGSISCVVTLFVTSILVLCVCSGLPPSGNSLDDDSASVASSLAPLNDGFKKIFTYNGNFISDAMATLLSIPATYATAFGFIFAYGRVVVSMARSRLFPPVLTATYGQYRTPYAAFLFGSAIGYALCVLVYFVPYVGMLLFNQCIVAAFFAYVSQCVGYSWFKLKHQNQHRNFVSPLGHAGAVYAGLVFFLSGIAVLFFQEDGYVALMIFSVQIVLYTLYYYAYARKRQQFSSEEKFVFIAQIVKYNERARRLASRRGRTQRSSFRDMFHLERLSAAILASIVRSRDGSQRSGERSTDEAVSKFIPLSRMKSMNSFNVDLQSSAKVVPVKSILRSSSQYLYQGNSSACLLGDLRQNDDSVRMEIPPQMPATNTNEDTQSEPVVDGDKPSNERIFVRRQSLQGDVVAFDATADSVVASAFFDDQTNSH